MNRDKEKKQKYVTFSLYVKILLRILWELLKKFEGLELESFGVVPTEAIKKLGALPLNLFSIKKE